ncbi:hypothetical protein K457DRAFT_127499 [Linnemannia elongata AG-77]|uniref:C2H2-type domain-containing protein n=1 Tax=Linnemannia elongata AG-77 TaxID=1314771 RepID=A0A197JPY8_9FUNG|nr:hypothetical protein K457DRAFT_127499 [Linnemannia elongata AG-77]
MKTSRKSSRVARALAAVRPSRTRIISKSRRSTNTSSSAARNQRTLSTAKKPNPPPGMTVKRSVGRPRTRPLTPTDVDMASDGSNSDDQQSDDDDNDDNDDNRDEASEVSRGTDDEGDSDENDDSDDNEDSDESGSEDTNSSEGDDDENDDEDENEGDSEGAQSANNRSVRSRRPLSSSSSTSTPSSGPLICPIKGCTRKFNNRQSLTSHIREHTPEEAGFRYPCTTPGCRFFSESRRGHATHSRTCGGDPSASYPCPWDDCERIFSTANGLAQHRRRHTVFKNPGNKKLTAIKSFAKKYRCHWPGCKKVTTRPKEFEEHLERHAEQQRKALWPCRVDGCKRAFETRSAMRSHLARCKEGKPDLQPPQPKEVSKAWLKSAPEAPTPSRSRKDSKYRCDVPGCGVALVSSWKLKRHKEWHEEHVLGVKWICLVKRCGKIEYPGTWNLLDHQARRHPELSADHHFPCPYHGCERMFPDQKEAYVHDCRLNKKKCTVKGCDCVLPNPESEEAHMLLHRILDAPPPYKCSERSCHQEYKDREEFFVHATGHIFEP